MADDKQPTALSMEAISQLAWRLPPRVYREFVNARRDILRAANAKNRQGTFRYYSAWTDVDVLFECMQLYTRLQKRTDDRLSLMSGDRPAPDNMEEQAHDTDS